MKTNRIRLTQPTLRTRAAVEDSLGEIRALTIHRNHTQLIIEQRKKELDDEYSLQMDADQKQIDLITESVHAWADANPGEFGGLKSAEFTHATIGWRTGQPTLKTLVGWTWDRVLEKLGTLGGKWKAYIREKQEVNKQALIADRDLLSSEDIRSIGLRVHQDEAFHIDPKIEAVENRQTVSA